MVEDAGRGEEGSVEVSPALTQDHDVSARDPAVILNIPSRHNATLHALVDLVNADIGLHALWRCANVNAVDRLGMSDHGPVHVRIVANIALRLFRMLTGAQYEAGVVRNHGLSAADGEVVVVLASLLHDVGMAVHRDDHERFSLILAEPKARHLLAGLYAEPDLTVLVSEVLHAIIAHRSDGHPLTLEAGVVRVADALDMAKGRSRIPFEAGQVNIHSVSAAAIDRVAIERGDRKPVRISIEMSNSAGIFQLDELLKEKLRGSGIEEAIEVTAQLSGESERSLVQVFRI